MKNIITPLSERSKSQYQTENASTVSPANEQGLQNVKPCDDVTIATRMSWSPPSVRFNAAKATGFGNSRMQVKETRNPLHTDCTCIQTGKLSSLDIAVCNTGITFWPPHQCKSLLCLQNRSWRKTFLLKKCHKKDVPQDHWRHPNHSWMTV